MNVGFPSWTDVGIPLEFINMVKKLPPCHFLDILVHHLVYRKNWTIHYIYHCAQCRYIYRPEKSSEEVVQCLNCKGQQLYCVPHLQSSRMVLQYSQKTSNRLFDIIDIMTHRFMCYFSTPPSSLNCGWDTEEATLYCQFPGGDIIRDISPRQCIIKAAILCPYLWNNFNWDNDNGTESINHFSPILNTLVGKMD